jgi:hypothetical protein
MFCAGTLIYNEVFNYYLLEKLSIRQRLVKNLFNEYDPYMVPTLNPKKARSVTVDLNSFFIKIVRNLKLYGQN